MSQISLEIVANCSHPSEILAYMGSILTIFLCRIMIILSSVAATLVFFDHSGDIIDINILTSVGVESTNAAWANSTATSYVLNHYTIEASPKKDAQVAYITTPDAAVHSVYGFYINYLSVQNYDISLICSSDTCLFRPQWRHNRYKYFNFCMG